MSFDLNPPPLVEAVDRFYQSGEEPAVFLFAIIEFVAYRFYVIFCSFSFA